MMQSVQFTLLLLQLYDARTVFLPLFRNDQIARALINSTSNRQKRKPPSMI